MWRREQENGVDRMVNEMWKDDCCCWWRISVGLCERRPYVWNEKNIYALQSLSKLNQCSWVAWIRTDHNGSLQNSHQTDEDVDAIVNSFKLCIYELTDNIMTFHCRLFNQTNTYVYMQASCTTGTTAARRYHPMHHCIRSTVRRRGVSTGGLYKRACSRVEQPIAEQCDASGEEPSDFMKYPRLWTTARSGTPWMLSFTLQARRTNSGKLSRRNVLKRVTWRRDCADKMRPSAMNGSWETVRRMRSKGCGTGIRVVPDGNGTLSNGVAWRWSGSMEGDQWQGDNGRCVSKGWMSSQARCAWVLVAWGFLAQFWRSVSFLFPIWTGNGTRRAYSNTLSFPRVHVDFPKIGSLFSIFGLSSETFHECHLSDSFIYKNAHYSITLPYSWLRQLTLPVVSPM